MSWWQTLLIGASAGYVIHILQQIRDHLSAISKQLEAQTNLDHPRTFDYED